ncbi:hypothetical protein RJ639_028968 [Escallonia herrerae]|uniref:RecA family profile 1 domain-containing protein n=1 Tax=Escallonia herrerae TaxID=1293975 RepID=A0AA88X642_9ASTE|nr:hypothetical protein RJ639_028968 [Escallonia herrerae]
MLRPEEQLQLFEREEIDDEDDLFKAIDKLTSHGINAGDVRKLQDAGIYTCNGLMMHTKKSLTGIKGLSEAKVDKICEAAEKIVVRALTWDRNFGNNRSFWGIQIWKDATRSYPMCFHTAPINMRGGNGKVAYFDTEGTLYPSIRSLVTSNRRYLHVQVSVLEIIYSKRPTPFLLVISSTSCTHSRPDHIVPIAESFGMDAGAVLDGIIYASAYTYEHQYNLLLGLAAKMSEEPFRLLIVDSVIALFRVDFTGRGELAERQQKLAQMLSRLIKIAEEFNVAVYMTNQGDRSLQGISTRILETTRRM